MRATVFGHRPGAQARMLNCCRHLTTYVLRIKFLHSWHWQQCTCHMLSVDCSLWCQHLQRGRWEMFLKISRTGSTPHCSTSHAHAQHPTTHIPLLHPTHQPTHTAVIVYSTHCIHIPHKSHTITHQHCFRQELRSRKLPHEAPNMGREHSHLRKPAGAM